MDSEKVLRMIPTETKILRSSRRVKVFKATECISYMSKRKYESEEIKRMLQELLENYKIIKVKQSPTNPNSVDILTGRSVHVTDTYMWAEDKVNHWNLIMGITIVSIFLVLVMFQMWPIWMRRSVAYLKYPIFAFIGFLVIAGVVRLIVYSITMFTHPPGLWILPNLFADCGFFESFVPLYSWEGEDVSHKKTEKRD